MMCPCNDLRGWVLLDSIIWQFMSVHNINTHSLYPPTYVVCAPTHSDSQKLAYWIPCQFYKATWEPNHQPTSTNQLTWLGHLTGPHLPQLQETGVVIGYSVAILRGWFVGTPLTNYTGILNLWAEIMGASIHYLSISNNQLVNAKCLFILTRHSTRAPTRLFTLKYLISICIKTWQSPNHEPIHCTHSSPHHSLPLISFSNLRLRKPLTSHPKLGHDDVGAAV